MLESMTSLITNEKISAIQNSKFDHKIVLIGFLDKIFLLARNADRRTEVRRGNILDH